jgi:bacteriochlorophyllide a dehydrogenase
MQSLAVIFEEPEVLELRRLALNDLGPDDLVVENIYSGISTGTERLLWSGRMPHFPGMGYPLVPGYESVGRVIGLGSAVKATGKFSIGADVFVPGANCFGDVRGLFGGTAKHVVVPAQRVLPVDAGLGEQGVLLALAATAHHAAPVGRAAAPDLIVGHGVLGRLIARLAIISGGPAPVVWETNLARHGGAEAYTVCDPAADQRRDYRNICDVSGDPNILDSLVQRLAPGGEITLAGFYSERLSFAFPPAFMREARIRVAAQWKPEDLTAVGQLVRTGQLSLDGLITHRSDASDAPTAYATAFGDPACLKMVLDWRQLS